MENVGALLSTKPGVMISSTTVLLFLLMIWLMLFGGPGGRSTERGSGEQSKKTIAYVDDDIDLADSVVAFIAAFIPNVDVKWYPTAELMLANSSIDPFVVILDGNIGPTFGWNYIPTIRSRWPKTIIIGYSTSDNASKFRDADSFVVKGSNPQALVDLLEALLK